MLQLPGSNITCGSMWKVAGGYPDFKFSKSKTFEINQGQPNESVSTGGSRLISKLLR